MLSKVTNYDSKIYLSAFHLKAGGFTNDQKMAIGFPGK